MENEIISNTSSLVFIGKLKCINLVKNLYKKILVPEEVISEIFKFNKPENNYIESQLKSGFIKKIKVSNLKDFPINIGEKSALSLCIEKRINLFLSDDKKARRYADSLGIKIIGILGIILKNLQLKNINKKEAKELIHNLIKNGYFMNSELYLKILQIIDFNEQRHP